MGVIPAREGSKGLPGKNIKPLLGKPLIAWTIEQALLSKYIDRVIVSTNDREIAGIAKNYGAEVPFLRPEELSADESQMIDVVLHAMNQLEINGDFYDSVILLQPTSPLRTAKDIDNVIEMLFLKDAYSIVSVCEVEHNPLWANTLPSDGYMKGFLRPEIENKNRQQLPIFYRVNGAIYVAYSDYIKTHRGFIGDKTYAYLMPRERSIDIDNEIDFEFAEFLLKKAKDFL